MDRSSIAAVPAPLATVHGSSGNLGSGKKHFICIFLHFFLASNGEIASQSARAPRVGARPCGAGRRMLSDVSAWFSTAIQGKLFGRAGVLGIIPHLRLVRCTRSTYARMAGHFTYELGRENNFPVISTPVLT